MVDRRGPKRGDGRGRPKTERAAKIFVSLYPRDIELVEFLTSYYGASRSEAVRTAIRAHAAAIGVKA